MTFLNVLLYVAVIGYVLFKKVQGHPMRAPKKLFGPPIVLIVLGFGDLSSGQTLKPVEITLIIIGAVLSVGLGLMRGQADKVSTRNGTPFVQWGKASLALFAANIVAKLGLGLIGVAAGDSASAVGKSLIFTLGLTLLAEAVVLWMRTGGATTLLNPQPLSTKMNDQMRRPAQSRAAVEQDDGAGWPRPQINQPEARRESETAVSRGFAAAIEHHQNHHEQHRNRHERRHDRGPRHERESS